MLYEKGSVLRVAGGFAWIKTENKLSCASCHVESSCGSGILEKTFARKLFLSKVINELNAKEGDEVVIAIPTTRVTQASIIAYFIPIVGLVVGSVFGHVYFQQEVYSIVFGLFGLLFGLLTIKLLNHKIKASKNFIPKMVRKSNTSLTYPLLNRITVKNL